MKFVCNDERRKKKSCDLSYTYKVICNSRGSKCTFISPVMYSFAKDELVIDKVIAVKDEVRVPQDKSFSDKLSGFFSSYYGFE